MVGDPLEVRLESDDLPSDKLRIHKLAGREAISELFSFDIELACTDSEGLDLDAAPGAVATLVFERKGVEVRRVHGMISEVHDHLDGDTKHRTYRMRLVPRAFRLTLVETQDIFIDKSIPEIIKHKLELCGIGADCELRLVGDYPKREFVTQFKETDLAFLSRLTEHLGISFFFEHHDGADKIVFTDHNAGFFTREQAIGFRAGGLERDVYALELSRRVIPSVYVVQDYNYRTPQLDLTSTFEAPSGYGGGIIEYGSHVKTPAESAIMARIRGEERVAAQSVFSGKSDLEGLFAGERVTLEGHAKLDKIELLLTEVEHAMTQVVANGSGDQQSYRNHFRAIKAATAYRPARRTPRPRMPSAITGIVDPGLGGGQKTPQIDEFGRYFVRLVFDTGGVERRASRPIRMAQPHGGANYGMHFPLKPGVEVLVAFVDGDPDRPVIVGAIPNPTTPSPVDGREATTNRLKTASGIVIELYDGH